MLEILNGKNETVNVPVNAIRDAGYHMASWNIEPYDSGKYSYRFRSNDYAETGGIMLRKS